MTASSKKVKYHTAASRWIHWCMALAIFLMLLLGAFMTDSLSLWQPVAIWLHISLGMSLFLFALIRLGNRFYAPQPTLPKSLASKQAKLARISHFLLYALMFLMPITGFLMVNADGRPASFFSLFYMPPLIEPSIIAYGLLRTLHGVFAYIFAGIIALHILAALHHGLIRQDRVLASMLFSKKVKTREIDAFLQKSKVD